MRVHAVAFGSGADASANAALAVAAVRAGAADGADLVVLPEYAAAFDPRGVGADLAEDLDGGFVTALRAAAREAGVAVVAGTAVPEGDRAANVVVAIDASGRLVGGYRKVHLYDAFGHRESDRLVAGDPAAPPLVLDVAGLPMGVLTCYDLRFPEVARRLVDAGAQVLLVPAAWAAGERKADHWETLLRARAIENTCYVVAAAQQGHGVVGDSLVVAPDGAVLARAAGAGAGAAVAGAAVADLAADAVAAVRERNPSLAHRRYAVVPRPPAADAPGSGAAPRRLWDRLLAVGIGLVALLGAGMVLAAGPSAAAFDALFFDGAGPVPDGAASDYLAFVLRVLGAVLVGWAVLLGWLTGRLRRRDPGAWRATVASLATWFVLDSTASLLSGFAANAVLNTVLALVLAVPLAGMRGELGEGQRPA